MKKLRDRHKELMETVEDAKYFFDLDSTDPHLENLKIVEDSENRLELTRNGYALVIRPWGWTWYMGDFVLFKGDFDE